MKQIVNAYAKINLTLDVGARRPDGYHEIESILHEIDLADTLEISCEPSLSSRIVLTVDGPEAGGVAPDETNLVYRAARSILETTSPFAVHVRLAKHIPSQAGLGGGSSDAGATLCALNALCNANLDLASLTKIAQSLGSDVPFFLTGGTAKIGGFGGTVVEIACPQRPLALVVVKPRAGLSTAAAYAAIDALPDRRLRHGTANWPHGGMSNDFEDAAYALVPESLVARDALTALGCRPVMLCGSGSAVFGITDDANSVWKTIVQMGFAAWVAKSAIRKPNP